jgi:hypothetical protein
MHRRSCVLASGDSLVLHVKASRAAPPAKTGVCVLPQTHVIAAVPVTTERCVRFHFARRRVSMGVCARPDVSCLRKNNQISRQVTAPSLAGARVLPVGGATAAKGSTAPLASVRTEGIAPDLSSATGKFFVEYLIRVTAFRVQLNLL